MAFETTRDILDHAKAFHQQLSELYAHLGETADQERIKVLLNYMSRHEEQLLESLSGYEDDASSEVLDTWFKFTPEMPKCKCFECVDLHPDMTVEDIVGVALKVDQCLINFYKETAEKAVAQEVKDLFNRLLEMEKKEETKCLRNMLIFDEQS